MRKRTRWIPTFIVALSGAVVCGVADADLYRWTDERGGMHYSNVREDVPAGVQVERLPDGAPPSSATPAPTQAAGPPAGAEAAAPPAVAPAGLDIERFELQRRYREAKDRLTAIDGQLKTLAAAIEGAPEGGEEAVVNLEERDAKELALQRERGAVTKQIDEMRARYADLRRQAAQANGGELPVEWERDLR